MAAFIMLQSCRACSASYARCLLFPCGCRSEFDKLMGDIDSVQLASVLASERKAKAKEQSFAKPMGLHSQLRVSKERGGRRGTGPGSKIFSRGGWRTLASCRGLRAECGGCKPDIARTWLLAHLSSLTVALPLSLLAFAGAQPDRRALQCA